MMRGGGSPAHHVLGLSWEGCALSLACTNDQYKNIRYEDGCCCGQDDQHVTWAVTECCRVGYSLIPLPINVSHITSKLPLRLADPLLLPSIMPCDVW